MKGKVLLVDDDPDEIELLKEAFSEVAPHVICDHAPNGYAALNILTSTDQPLPDIILVDINMPVMNGWEFLRNVKASERLKEIPVVVYTTANRETDHQLAASLGAVRFVNKPDNFLVLKRELESILQGLKTAITRINRFMEQLKIAPNAWDNITMCLLPLQVKR